jgi:hypothetical protein
MVSTVALKIVHNAKIRASISRLLGVTVGLHPDRYQHGNIADHAIEWNRSHVRVFAAI